MRRAGTRALPLALLALALVSAACGRGPTNVGAGQNAAGASPTASPTSAAGGPGAAGTDASGSGAPGSAGGTESNQVNPQELPTEVPGVTQAKLKVTMGSSCITPGSTQTITLESEPNLQFAWGTLWPDGSGHPDWKAYGTGIFTATGTHTEPFLVPANAPLGRARTDVTVAGEINDEQKAAMAHPFWDIKSSC